MPNKTNGIVDLILFRPDRTVLDTRSHHPEKPTVADSISQAPTSPENTLESQHDLQWAGSSASSPTIGNSPTTVTGNKHETTLSSQGLQAPGPRTRTRTIHPAVAWWRDSVLPMHVLHNT